MAKIEIINEMPQVNVSASVGRNGVNNESDVIAVQGLMKYALEDTLEWRGIKFPEPSGVMDSTMRAIIKRYQRHLKRHVKNTTVDGRIDPAKGLFTNGGKTMWTIMALNTDAINTWVLGKRIGVNHVHAIGTLYPAFKAAIGDKGVGTLNLPLDGGYEGVGTLGLELE